MTVSELIEELQGFEPDLEVRVDDNLMPDYLRVDSVFLDGSMQEPPFVIIGVTP